MTSKIVYKPGMTHLIIPPPTNPKLHITHILRNIIGITDDAVEESPIEQELRSYAIETAHKAVFFQDQMQSAASLARSHLSPELSHRVITALMVSIHVFCDFGSLLKYQVSYETDSESLKVTIRAVYDRLRNISEMCSAEFFVLAAEIEAESYREQSTEIAEQGLQDRYVSLAQITAIIKDVRSKRTIERWIQDGLFPSPSIEGGGGRPHLWLWSDIRPVLQERTGMNLPEKFPSLINGGQ